MERSPTGAAGKWTRASSDQARLSAATALQVDGRLQDLIWWCAQHGLRLKARRVALRDTPPHGVVRRTYDRE